MELAFLGDYYQIIVIIFCVLVTVISTVVKVFKGRNRKEDNLTMIEKDAVSLKLEVYIPKSLKALVSDGKITPLELLTIMMSIFGQDISCKVIENDNHEITQEIDESKNDKPIL